MEALQRSSIRPAPVHVAVIMDGNGRWAQERGLPRTAGHREGANAVRRAMTCAGKIGIDYLTLYGFSSENWNRPVREVDDLMGLLRRYLQTEIDRLQENGVRLRVIGERNRLAPDIVRMIGDAEEATKANDGLNLTVALSYGGRQDILNAARCLAERAAAGDLDPSDIDEAVFGAKLATVGLPDPDLLIRTGGEQRISNFLLWQSAYSELVFIDKYWPEFAEEDLTFAIQEFQQRDRRYGAAVGSG